MSHKNKIHIQGLDILKICTLLAITVLHTNEFVFYKDEFPLGSAAPFWVYVCYFGRLFAIGGQVLISIIFFLFGFHQKKRNHFFKVCAFSFVGQTILYFSFNILEWDIYSYLFFTTLLIGSFDFILRENKHVFYFSLLALLIPNNFYTGIFSPSSFFSLITGTSALSPSGAWPLFPWFFLATLFYQLGLKIKNEWVIFQTWRKNELLFWSFLFILSLPFLGHYYHSPLGPNFYRFTFHQSSIHFWSNFLPFLFLGRISLLKNVDSIIQKSLIASFISKSYWNKYLGLTYLVSIIYLTIGMKFNELFQREPFYFDLFFIGLMPSSEFLSRFIVLIKKKVISK